jgi:hypothetical protein
MTKIGKVSGKDKNRLQTLRNRRERLIELNLTYKFSQTGNEKINKYYACILYIRRQIGFEECKNVRPLKKRTSIAFQGFLNPQNGLTLKDLRNLTTPVL